MKSSANGIGSGSWKRERARAAAYASAKPPTAPSAARITLSVSSCEMRRPRPAPTARRMPISRCRSTARASIRLATLAHAISNTSATTTMRMAISPPTHSRSPGIRPALSSVSGLAALVLSISLVDARVDNVQGGRGLRPCNAGLQPARDADPMGRALLGILDQVGDEIAAHRERRPEFGDDAAVGPMEARRHDADDRISAAVKDGRLAYCGRVGGEPAAPKRVAEHDDRVASFDLIVLGPDAASGSERRPHHRKVISADQRAPDALGRRRAGRETGGSQREMSRKAVENRGALVAEVAVIRVRKGPAGRNGVKSAGGVADGERAEQGGIDHAEDRRIGGNSERDRDTDDRGEAGRFANGAQREHDVMHAAQLSTWRSEIPACACLPESCDSSRTENARCGQVQWIQSDRPPRNTGTHKRNFFLTVITICNIVIADCDMTLGEKLRYLREVEGTLRGLDRELSQQELARLIQKEQGKSISQSYLSQIESGARPHLTNSSRMLLARFFKVHPGYLVDDPGGISERADLRRRGAGRQAGPVADQRRRAVRARCRMCITRC